jgi:4-hydroxy-2-oxoheptanedioate aldolase
VRPNPLKEALAGGQVQIGLAITGPSSPEVPIIYKQAGLDFILLENEHLPKSLESDEVVIRSAKAVGLPAIVRVPDAEYHLIARTLDTGADGIILPRVEDRATAEFVVECAKFPPMGRRGFGLAPFAMGHEAMGVGEAAEYFNANLVTVIQVESPGAIEQAEAIASVPGVDAIVIGPADLSLRLGIPGGLDDPRFKECVEAVIAAGKKAGIASGIFMGDRARVKRYIEMGMRWFSCGSEEGLVRAGARALVEEVRGAK